MITGASWKPFSAVRSPVVPLNENVSPGAISAPSISCATSGDVVQAARDAAVGRVVAADDAGDPHRLRLGRRALGRRRADDELGAVRPVGRDRGREERLRRRRHVDAEAGLVRHDLDAAAGVDLEARVDGRVLDGLAQLRRTRPRRPGLRSRARSRRRRGARGARRSASAAASSACPRTRAGRAPRARCRAWRAAGARSAARDLDRVDADRKRDGCRRARAGRARGRSAGGRLPGRASGRAGPGTTSIDEPAAHELRLDVALVDLRLRGRRACSRARPRRPGRAAAMSAPKKRACRRRKPRTGPKPSPSRAAVSSAAAQSASTPSVVALIG